MKRAFTCALGLIATIVPTGAFALNAISAPVKGFKKDFSSTYQYRLENDFDQSVNLIGNFDNKSMQSNLLNLVADQGGMIMIPYHNAEPTQPIVLDAPKIIPLAPRNDNISQIPVDPKPMPRIVLTHPVPAQETLPPLVPVTEQKVVVAPVVVPTPVLVPVPVPVREIPREKIVLVPEPIVVPNQIVPAAQAQPVAPVRIPVETRSRAAMITRAPADPVSTGPSVGTGRWHAALNSTLDQVLADWADRAGWTVVFNSKMIYRLQASADFQGDFIEAASALVKSIKAPPQPFATFYRGNKALVITNNADQTN